MLGLLRRNIFNCSAEVKAIAYKALVRPRLEYCSAVWDPYHRTHINIVERIQRRAARFVSKDYSRETSATSSVQNLEWDTLEERRTKCRLITIYKEAHGLIPSNIDHLRHKKFYQSHRLHGQHSFIHPAFNKDCFKYSLYPRSIPEWNLLPDGTKMAPDLLTFKTVLNTINVRDLVSKAHFKI